MVKADLIHRVHQALLEHQREGRHEIPIGEDPAEGVRRISHGLVVEAVESLFESLKDAMARGERIEFRGFGVFQVKPRKRGVGRNPRTGREVKIPPGRTVRFKPGKELRDIGP